MVKFDCYPSKIRSQARMSAITTSVQDSEGSSQHEKQKSSHPDWKRKSKILIMYGIIVCRENLMESTKKLLSTNM